MPTVIYNANEKEGKEGGWGVGGLSHINDIGPLFVCLYMSLCTIWALFILA